MAVRTLTLTKSKLSKTGLALLDWGHWSGKPAELGDKVVVPVWRDTYYRESVFHVSVYPPGRIHDSEPRTIERKDLQVLNDGDVNHGWNRIAEIIMKRIDKQNLLIMLPEEINRLPTKSYLNSTPTPRQRRLSYK